MITRDKLKNRAERGVRAEDIAKEFKLKTHQVYYLLRKYKFKIKNKRAYDILDEDKDLILSLIDYGMIASEIGEKWAEEYPCIKRHTVGEWMRLRGYSRRNIQDELKHLSILASDDLRTSLANLCEPSVIKRDNGKHHVIMPADYFIELERRANAN